MMTHLLFIDLFLCAAGLLRDEHHPALHSSIGTGACRLLCTPGGRGKDKRGNIGAAGVHGFPPHAGGQCAEDVPRDSSSR